MEKQCIIEDTRFLCELLEEYFCGLNAAGEYDGNHPALDYRQNGGRSDSDVFLGLARKILKAQIEKQDQEQVRDATRKATQEGEG